MLPPYSEDEVLATFEEAIVQSRKTRSNYRRPSSLGLATTPLPDQSESGLQYKPKPVGRSHIVAPLKDHLRPEGAFEKISEVRANYRNLSPVRPIIHKLKDHLKPEGDIARRSETGTSYDNKHPTRPIIFKLRDHDDYVQPEGIMEKASEYNSNFAKSMKGERAPPAWISDFQKVTIE